MEEKNDYEVQRRKIGYASKITSIDKISIRIHNKISNEKHINDQNELQQNNCFLL